MRSNPDFERAPLLVYWEVTQACDLACRHCRADAMPRADPAELTTAEGLALLDRLEGFGDPLPHIVFTGGDPLKRADLFGLMARARRLGFTIAITPSGTPLLTREVVRRFKEAGVWMMALSLDGPDAPRHDAIRGVPGTFERTVRAADWAREVGIPLQVNTLVCKENAPGISAVHDLARSLGAERWSLFFLVAVGRGRELTPVEPGEGERILRWLAQTARHSPLLIKTTEAPHYRRVLSTSNGGVARGAGVRDGCGILFLSHRGEIFPSGFLPLPAGNVRTDDPVAVYREGALFRALRQPRLFKGRCGACGFAGVCGGSRARAFAATGDPLESDPLCPYRPPRPARSER